MTEKEIDNKIKEVLRDLDEQIKTRSSNRDELRALLEQKSNLLLSLKSLELQKKASGL